MDVGALEIARREVRHSESFFGCLACGRKRWRIFFVERQIIGRVPVAKEPDGLVLVAADFVQILS